MATYLSTSIDVLKAGLAYNIVYTYKTGPASRLPSVQRRAKQISELGFKQGFDEIAELASAGSGVRSSADIARSLKWLGFAVTALDALSDLGSYEGPSYTTPIDGTVQASAITTVGQVVSAGAELMRIIPGDGALEVEAYLPNRDIGFVAIGQPVVVKVEAFPFTRYGTVNGRVTGVARDAIPEPERRAARGRSGKGFAEFGSDRQCPTRSEPRFPGDRQVGDQRHRCRG
jgi:hypothetical protein